MSRYWITFIAAALIAVASVAPAAAQDEDPVTVGLEEVEGSGYSGTGELTSENDATNVSIELEGDDENGAENDGYFAMIYEGTCDDLGVLAYELGDSEELTFETTVPVSLDELTQEEHAIGVHTFGEDVGQPLACGEIAAAPAEDDAATEEDDEAAVDDEDDAILEDDDDEAVEDDDAIVEEDDDAAVEDDDAAAVEDEDDTATEDEDPVVVEDDDEELDGVGGPAAEDDTEDVAPATGSFGSGAESGLFLIVLLATAALGAGFLLRRRATHA